MSRPPPPGYDPDPVCNTKRFSTRHIFLTRTRAASLCYTSPFISLGLNEPQTRNKEQRRSFQNTRPASSCGVQPNTLVWKGGEEIRPRSTFNNFLLFRVVSESGAVGSSCVTMTLLRHYSWSSHFLKDIKSPRHYFNSTEIAIEIWICHYRYNMSSKEAECNYLQIINVWKG